MTRRKFALLSGAAAVGAYGSIKLQKTAPPPGITATSERRAPRANFGAFAPGRNAPEENV